MVLCRLGNHDFKYAGSSRTNALHLEADETRTRTSVAVHMSSIVGLIRRVYKVCSMLRSISSLDFG